MSSCAFPATRDGAISPAMASRVMRMQHAAGAILPRRGVGDEADDCARARHRRHVPPLNQGPRCPQSSVPDPTRTLAPRRRIGIPRARNEADAPSANAARNERERDDWLGNLRAQCEMCSVQIATRAWVGGGVLVQPPPIRLARCRLRPTSGGDRTALPGIDIVQVFFEVRQQRTERIPAARTHTLGVNPLSQRELA